MHALYLYCTIQLIINLAYALDFTYGSFFLDMLAWTGGKRKLLEASQNFHGRSFAKQNAQQRMHEKGDFKPHDLNHSQDTAAAIQSGTQLHSLLAIQLSQCLQRQHAQAAAQGSCKRRRTAPQGQSIDMLMCNGLYVTSKESTCATVEPCPQLPTMPEIPAAAAAGCNTSSKLRNTSGTTNQPVTTCSEQAQSSCITPPRLSAAAAKLAPHTTATAATNTQRHPAGAQESSVEPNSSAAPSIKAAHAGSWYHGLAKPAQGNRPQGLARTSTEQQCKQHIGLGKAPLEQVPNTTVQAAGTPQSATAGDVRSLQHSVPNNLHPLQQQLAAPGSLQDNNKQARWRQGSYDMLFLNGSLLE